MPTDIKFPYIDDQLSDAEVYVLSTIGQGPKGDKGDDGVAMFPTYADPIEWDIQTDYDVRTIVLYGGDTYISKKPVPHGIDISDTDYWQYIDTSDAQIEAMRQVLPYNAFSSVNTVKKYIDGGFDGVEQKLDKRAVIFDTVANMKASTSLKAGMICHTNGFHSAGDGGAGWYRINSSGISNEMDVIACQNSLLASLIINDRTVTLESLGATLGNDAYTYMARAYQIAHVVIVNNYGYLLSQPVRIPENCSLLCKHTMSYLVDGDSNHYHFTWSGGSGYPMFTTVSGENVTSYIYDDYPKSGITIDGLRVNGNGTASMGILICAQRNSRIDRIAATNCLVGIVVTRSWGICIGSVESHGNDLGFSTVPATSLNANGTPIVPADVSDASVNNVSIENINLAQNKNGLYIGLALQTSIQTLNSEEPASGGKYHLYLHRTNCFLGNVHIENLDAFVNDDFIDVYVMAPSNFMEVPSFGVLQCNSIYSESSFNIDTLMAYYRGSGSNIPVRVKFYGPDASTNWKPFVRNFAWDYQQYNTGEYLPIARNPIVSEFQDGSYKLPVCGNNYVQILLYSDVAYTDGGTITFTNSRGGSTTFTIPEIDAKQLLFYQVPVPYGSVAYGNITATVAGVTSGIINIMLGYNMIADRVLLRRKV